MNELFNEIRTDRKWRPIEIIDYSFVDIEKLKKLTDNWFDKLVYKGGFFHEYNEVLQRIEILKQHIKLATETHGVV